MKNKLHQFLLVFVLALNLVLVSIPANAYYYYYHNGYYRYHRPHHCRVVGGYWSHGYWHEARRVCWYR